MTRLTWEPITLHFRTPFRVSYGTSETRRAHWLRLADDEGWGEGTIPPYYGISDASLAAVWDAAARRTDPFPDDPAAVAAWLAADPAIAAGPAPARAVAPQEAEDSAGGHDEVEVAHGLHVAIAAAKARGADGGC